MRVLIAEDYSDSREVLRRAFEKAGWEVIAAKDGREALYLYHLTVHEEKYFDLLLLDVQMPRLNGIAVGVNVRNLEKFGDVRKSTHVYLTGHDEDLNIHGEELVAISFADDYIRKPVDPFELIERVTKLVTRKASSPG